MKLNKFSCRSNLTEQDLAFAESIQDVQYELKSWACPESRDDLLDSDVLFHAILNDKSILSISAWLYFYVLTRRSLVNESIDCRDTADYLASLLISATHPHDAFPQVLPEGVRQLYLSDALDSIEKGSSTQQFFMRAELANITLYMTGVFGEHLNARTHRKAAPNVSFYEDVSRAQYSYLTDHPLSNEHDLSNVFQCLSSQFSQAKSALVHLSESLTFLGDGSQAWDFLRSKN